MNSAPSTCSALTNSNSGTSKHSISGRSRLCDAFMRVALHCSPGWFACNMGIGIVCNLVYLAPLRVPGMQGLSITLYAVNLILFTVLCLFSLARYALFPGMFQRVLQHPAESLLLGTFPMGLATLINSSVLIAVPKVGGTWLQSTLYAVWWFDTTVSLLSAIVVPMYMFHVQELSLQTMNAAWMLPIVPPIVAAAAGRVVATVLSRDDAVTTIVISYMQLGLGMGLSMLIMVIYFYRLSVHKLPAAGAVVSAFLPLGPPGMSAFSLIQLAEVGMTVFGDDQFAGIVNAAEIVYVSSVISALCLWGFGIWWLLHAVLSVFVKHALNATATTNSSSNGSRERLQSLFSLGYWAYTFPLGVNCLAAISLARALQSSVLSWVAMLYILILLVLLSAVSYGTAVCALRGTLRAPCITNDWQYYSREQQQPSNAVTECGSSSFVV
jgi:tellurite resistance protein TehA-like permease